MKEQPERKSTRARKHTAEPGGQPENRVVEKEAVARDVFRNVSWNSRASCGSWSCTGVTGMVQPS